ncbi:MAG: hypothetical protein AAF927_07110 [Bacteroidota bacterium]
MKTSRILFLIVSAMFVAIGSLHLTVHFSALTNDDYQAALSAIDFLQLSGKPAHIWLLWQGFSMMMGVGLIGIGLLNLGYLLGNSPLFSPPIAVFIIMILFLIVVIVSGFLYFEMAQVYGGILGIGLLLLSLFYKKK